MNVRLAATATVCLLLLPLDVLGHTVVDDNGCVDLVAPDDATVWYLVNSCPYSVHVAWCSSDDLTGEPKCGGAEYYRRYGVLDPTVGTVAMEASTSQDLSLSHATCRMDHDAAGFNGIDMDSLAPDGSFTCLVGQQVHSAFSLFVTPSETPGLDAKDCITFSMKSRNLHGNLVHDVMAHNRCAFPVEIFWCHRFNDVEPVWYYCGDASPNPNRRYYKNHKHVPPGDAEQAYMFWDETWIDTNLPIPGFTDSVHFEYGACRIGGTYGIGEIAADGTYVCVDSKQQ